MFLSLGLCLCSAEARHTLPALLATFVNIAAQAVSRWARDRKSVLTCGDISGTSPGDIDVVPRHPRIFAALRVAW